MSPCAPGRSAWRAVTTTSGDRDRRSPWACGTAPPRPLARTGSPIQCSLVDRPESARSTDCSRRLASQPVVAEGLMPGLEAGEGGSTGLRVLGASQDLLERRLQGGVGLGENVAAG